MSVDILTQLVGLPQVVVTDYALPDDETIVLDIEVRREAATCPTCARVSTTIHSTGERRTVRDQDVWGRQCYLRLRPRQFACAPCRCTFVERLAWLDSGQHQTRRFEMRVFELARRTNVVDAATYHGLTDERAEGILLREATRRVAARGYPLVEVLHVDEIASRKGHGHYRLVLSAPGVGVLDVLSDRRKETLVAWLEARGPAWCAAVQEFHADMWAPYHEAAREKLPNVRTSTADHFHVTKNLNEALGEVRKAVQRAADADTRAQLKGSRWVLVKDPAHLSAEEQERLAVVLQASAELKTNYELKEDFRAIYALTDPDAARQRLGEWVEQACAVGHQALQSFVRTVENWWDEILSFFDSRGSNGFAEGVNNKIKLILRRAFGCPNFAHLRLRILVAFGL
jgi:transposase